MATRANAAEDKEQPAEGTDGPLLDLNDAAVKKLIKTAKKRGYVTHDELNEVLPSEEVTSEQIEDMMAMLNDMGINVVEQEEQDEAEEQERAREEEADEKPPASRRWTLPGYGDDADDDDDDNRRTTTRKTSSRSRPGYQRQTVTEAVIKSVARSAASSLGRALVRGILGSLKKGF